MLNIKFSINKFKILKSDKEINFDFESNLDMQKVRSEFNKVISTMTLQNYDNEIYQLLKISERNVLDHPSFLNFCRIKLIESTFSRKHKIEVYTDQISIFLYFNKILKISFTDKSLFYLKYLLQYLTSYFKFLKSFCSVVYNKFLTIDLNKNEPLVNKLIIQTFVSDKSFKDGRFTDFYYGEIYKDLKAKKIWPIFYNLKNKHSAFKFFKKNKSNFLILEDYLSFSDFLKYFLTFIKMKNYKPYSVYRKDFEFFSFIKYWVMIDFLGKEYFYFILIKKLQKQNSKNLSFLFNQENLIPQKITLLAINKFFPSSKTFGYFHTTKPNNLLNLDFCSKEDFILSPRPKQILFNSNYYRKYYKKKWPKLICENVISLKYKDYKLKKINFLSKKNKYLNILLILPPNLEEFFHYTSIVKSIPKKYNVFLKTHPMNKININEYYSDYICVDNWSKNKILNYFQIVISGYSGFVIEFACVGKKIGIIYNPEQILINPFDNTIFSNYSLIKDKKNLQKFLNNQKNIKAINFFNTKKHFKEKFTSLLNN